MFSTNPSGEDETELARKTISSCRSLEVSQIGRCGGVLFCMSNCDFREEQTAKKQR